MANTTSVTSSFAGNASEFFLSALDKSKTATTNGITLKDQIEYKYIPRGFDMTGIIQTGFTGTWNSQGATTITEDPLQVQPFYVNKSENFGDYVSNHFDVSSDALPAEVESAIASKVADAIGAEIEAKLWKGNTAASTVSGNTYTKTLFAGYNAILKAGSAISVGGTVLSKSNIIAELEKVYNALPDALKSQDPSKLVIFCSYKAEGYYKQALAALNINTPQTIPVATYMDIEVRGVGQFTNVMAAGLRESFHIASNTGLGDGQVSANIKNMYPVTLERHARVEAFWKYVPAITNKTQVVLYNM